MTENAAPHLTASQQAGIRTEADALRYCLTRTEADARAAALVELNACACWVPGWIGACARTAAEGTALDWPAALAILDRPALKSEKADLAAGAVELQAALDPREAARAFDRVKENQARAGISGRIRAAQLILTEAQAEADPERARALALDAAGRLARYDADGETSLAEAWEAHLDAKKAEAGPLDVLRLAACRGTLADWINDCMGPRGGLEPGQTFILGGGPESGKTSLAAVFAVDALALGVPVLFWQLELSREETLEHLQAQRPDLDGWPVRDFWTRARAADLPQGWETLLTVPRFPEPDAESIRAALLSQARRNIKHACKGLVIVDYMQLITIADAGPRLAGHEILATAASRLSKAAAESGACLLLLSQMNKQEQRESNAEGTALAGADLARMAHRVALLQKADAEGNPRPARTVRNAEKVNDWKPAWDKDKGEARRLAWTKRRGMRYAPDGTRPDAARILWNGGRGRGFNGEAAPQGSKEGGLEIDY
jgi:KaiC/GvpD/RAD55 family RecA-like ATPase